MSGFVELVGFTAAILTTIAFLPQVVKTWVTGSARDLSLPMLASLATGVALWFFYGLAIGVMPIIVANGITLCLVGLLLVLKVAEIRRSGA